MYTYSAVHAHTHMYVYVHEHVRGEKALSSRKSQSLSHTHLLLQAGRITVSGEIWA